MSYPPKFLLTAEQLRQEYESGLTQSQIGDKYGVTQTAVGHHMRDAGIPRRHKGKQDQTGPNNPAWKGDNACYSKLHARVYKLRGQPQRCEVCETTDPEKHYDWANLTGQFHDINDYKRMCRSCHWKHDRKHLNLGRYSQRKTS